jgi:dihydroorotate dehydrogenase
MFNNIILSPPFSNIYPQIKNTTKIVGTYTLKKRKGLHRVLTTLKKTENGWLNNVGLRNPGIENYNKKNSIISISILEEGDFEKILYYLYYLKYEFNILGVEFNISCPNHNVLQINEKIIQDTNRLIGPTIIKISHDINKDNLIKLCDINSHFIHISNTKKTNSGALSGKDLQKKNIENIKLVKELYPNKKIIAGGGIYSFYDLLSYKDAGAEFFSLSTVLLNPYKAYKIINQWSQYQKQN